MDGIVIAIIAVLCQYPLAIATLIKLFRSDEPKNTMIAWNVFIIAVPFIGVVSYWIYFLISRKNRKKPEAPAEKINGEIADIGERETQKEVSENENND